MNRGKFVQSVPGDKQVNEARLGKMGRWMYTESYVNHQENQTVLTVCAFCEFEHRGVLKEGRRLHAEHKCPGR